MWASGYANARKRRVAALVKAGHTPEEAERMKQEEERLMDEFVDRLAASHARGVNPFES